MKEIFSHGQILLFEIQANFLNEASGAHFEKIELALFYHGGTFEDISEAF